jgi:hypothetical protein
MDTNSMLGNVTPLCVRTPLEEHSSMFVLPFTKLSSDAVRMSERVKEAQAEVEVCQVVSTETTILLTSPT